MNIIRPSGVFLQFRFGADNVPLTIDTPTLAGEILSVLRGGVTIRNAHAVPWLLGIWHSLFMFQPPR